MNPYQSMYMNKIQKAKVFENFQIKVNVLVMITLDISSEFKNFGA